MKNLALYSIGGLGAVIVLAAIIKKKPGRFQSGKTALYIVAPHDKMSAVSARFGISNRDFLQANATNKAQKGVLLMPGTVKILPAGAQDRGKRAGAMGVSK